MRRQQISHYTTGEYLEIILPACKCGKNCEMFTLRSWSSSDMYSTLPITITANFMKRGQNNKPARSLPEVVLGGGQVKRVQVRLVLLEDDDVPIHQLLQHLLHWQFQQLHLRTAARGKPSVRRETVTSIDSETDDIRWLLTDLLNDSVVILGHSSTSDSYVESSDVLLSDADVCCSNDATPKSQKAQRKISASVTMRTGPTFGLFTACVLVFGGGWGVVGQSVVTQNDDASEGTISFQTPTLNDEEAHSVHMPSHLKCDACTAVVYQLSKGFDDFHGRRNYGVKEVKKVKRLSGPGLETAESPGIMAGGGKWPERMKRMCNLYVEEFDEERIYAEYKAGKGRLQKLLCANTIHSTLTDVCLDLPSSSKKVTSNKTEL
ncbi:MZB1-like protein [Mya arenaria]|uniref:MZB1-like protein n=1 Tax=Mya arenaria TaxID=6604 RepID=A0ABY7DKX6_MYAAR|nr:MZB1-like protein [Mya arenaria]